MIRKKQRISDGIVGGIIGIGIMSCFGANYSAHIMVTPSFAIYDTKTFACDNCKEMIQAGKDGYEVKSSHGDRYGTFVVMQKRIN